MLKGLLGVAVLLVACGGAADQFSGSGFAEDGGAGGSASGGAGTVGSAGRVSPAGHAGSNAGVAPAVDSCAIGRTRACLDNAGRVGQQYCQNTDIWLPCEYLAPTSAGSGAGGSGGTEAVVAAAGAPAGGSAGTAGTAGESAGQGGATLIHYSDADAGMAVTLNYSTDESVCEGKDACCYAAQLWRSAHPGMATNTLVSFPAAQRDQNCPSYAGVTDCWALANLPLHCRASTGMPVCLGIQESYGKDVPFAPTSWQCFPR